MNYLMGFCFSLLLITTGHTDSTNTALPPNVVKVDKKNNPDCVVYLTYKGELYCSFKALDKTSVDPEIVSYEKQNVQFDNRVWKAVWGQKTNAVTTVEYIPLGDNIDHWSELVTSQYMPGLTDTPQEFKKRFIANLDKSGITYSIHTIEEQPNKLIFEFKVTVPINLQQDEIQKITKTKDGIYILHYAIKKSDMSTENRQKWIKNLKKSTLKE